MGSLMWVAYVGGSILFLIGWQWRPLALATTAVLIALGLMEMSED